MAVDGKVVFQIEADDSKLKQGLDSATDDIAKKTAKWNTFANTAVSVIGNVVRSTASGIKALLQNGIEYNAQMQTYTTAFTTALGDQEKAYAAIEKIREDAAKTPFGMSELVQANQFLISTGESAESARDTILALTDAISATGGGADELVRMAQNLQQVKNAGQATAMDLRQFAYAGIDIYGLISDYTGQTTEEVKDMTVSYDLLNRALVAASKEGGKYFGANIAQSKTFNGQISTLKDNFSEFNGQITEGAFELLAQDALPMVNEWLSRLADAFEGGGFAELGQEAGSILGEAFDAGWNWVVENAPDMLDNLVNAIIDGAPGAVSAVSQWIATEVPKLLDGLIGTAVNAMPNLVATFGNGLIDSLNSFFGINLPHIPDISFPSWEEIKETVASWWGDGSGGILGFLKNALVWTFGKLQNIDWGAISGQVSEWWNESIKPALLGVLNWTLGILGLPSWEDLSAQVKDWWDGTFRPAMVEVLNWWLGKLGLPEWSELSTQITNWWNNSFFPSMRSVLDWTLGVLNFPSWEEISAAASNWWAGIKQGLKNIFTVDISTVFSTSNKDTNPNNPYNENSSRYYPHARGGVFTKETTFQDAGGSIHTFGEAGPEALVPLDNLWSQMDRVADTAISAKIASSVGPYARSGVSEKSFSYSDLWASMPRDLFSSMPAPQVRVTLDGEEITAQVSTRQGQELQSYQMSKWQPR